MDEVQEIILTGLILSSVCPIDRLQQDVAKIIQFVGGKEKLRTVRVRAFLTPKFEYIDEATRTVYFHRPSSADAPSLRSIPSRATKRLLVLPDEGVQVEWSPDGRKLASTTTSLRAYGTDLHTRKTRRLTPKHFQDFAAVFDSGVDWSPDARFLAIARGECVDVDCHQGFNTVAVVNARTGRVVRNPGVDCPTTYSPRGELRCTELQSSPFARGTAPTGPTTSSKAWSATSSAARAGTTHRRRRRQRRSDRRRRQRHDRRRARQGPALRWAREGPAPRARRDAGRRRRRPRS